MLEHGTYLINFEECGHSIIIHNLSLDDSF